jgi:hypothetical protein
VISEKEMDDSLQVGEENSVSGRPSQKLSILQDTDR